MSYFIWNGISSKEYGVLKNPSVPSGSMNDFEYISIPNRVPIAKSLKTRQNTKISFLLQFNNRKVYDYLYSWLNNGNREGVLIVSDDLTKYYKATCTSVTTNYMSLRFSSVDITFTCVPFRYSIDNEPILLESNGTVNVGGNYYSEPRIKIYGNGSGTLAVNGVNLSVYVDSYLTVDTERLLAYKDNVVALSQTAGVLPTFQVGANTIAFNGGISKVEIYKNERWL